MKSSKCVGVWRPLMGVAMVGALALGVSALAGPRGTDEAVRGTTKAGTEVTRLVTGDPAQINAVVSGTGATLKLAVKPVNPPQGRCIGGACTSGSSIGSSCTTNADCPSLPGYPAGIAVNGSELTIDRSNNKDGFRAWFNVQVSDWDPMGDGANMSTYQVKIDCNGYYQSDCLDLIPPPPSVCVGGTNPGTPCPLGTECTGGGECVSDGLDLKPSAVACPGDDPTPCQTTFGEEWASCTSGVCDAGYIDSAGRRQDSWCTPGGGGCTGFGVAIGTCNFNWFTVSNAIAGHPDQPATCVGGGRPGQGCNTAVQCPGGGTCTGPKLPNYYGGTLVLDIPADAKGKYTVNLNTNESFGAVVNPGGEPLVIESASETGFVINVVGGSCCHNLGTASAGCFDQCINRSDCENAGNAPFVFTAGGTCENKPTADGCSECTTPGNDPLCNDNDACTTETCVIIGGTGICQRGNIAGYTAGICCDPTNGNLAPAADTNPCTDDKCSLDPVSGTPKPGNGVPVHTPASVTTPCDDLNPCTFGDHCAGTTATCTGNGVVGQACATNDDCTHGGQTPPGLCVGGACACSPEVKVTFVLDTTDPKTCVGGSTPGARCAKDADCSGGGTCGLFPANCFDEGEKISALVNLGPAGSPINGGQFQINYDPSCVDYNSVACLPPYVTTVYGPKVDEAAGTIFIACGVDAFAGIDGPLGNVNMIALNFTMIGQCNNCELCFGNNNPQNSYLVDDKGQKVGTNVDQCKEIAEFGDLVLNVPDNIKTNSDCDIPAATVNWAAPSASFSCGDVNLTCRGAHESGLVLTQAVVMGGGLLPQGANSFCCYASAKDKCEQTAGCPGAVNDCGTPPDGCWTVEVNDTTSLDIHIQLEPVQVADADGDTRCIEFCLYGNCAEAPYCFQENVLFDGLYNFVGKANGTIKVPKGKYGCITAQDQLHSLRSCADPDCIDGELQADFKGDPTYGGNWLIMGNLDGWKKDDTTADPSLEVIDILDYGTFVSQYGVCYEDRKYGCHEGPHADIDGDGCVTTADYNFVLRNFLVSAKDCCCGPAAAGLPAPLVEITIEQLNAMGQGDLAVADLNGDGVLNAEDMDAFTQGVRPAKSNDRKGGKGLRSGR